jgi:protease-4
MFRSLFRAIGAILSFINNHIKALLFLLFIGWLLSQSQQDPTQTPNLAQVSIHGAIEDVSELVEKIDSLKNDDSIKGVLLHVDSPGGALGPSVELMLAVKSLANSKPVVAYAAGTMASGSYYASIYAQKIVANPGAFVGSIGVLFQAPNIQPLADKVGIKEQVVTAGKYKQMGTFTREWQKHEKDALQKLVDEAYEMFVKDVATARKLDGSKDDIFAQGQLFLATKAKEIGLIDDIGGYLDSKRLVEKLSKVQKPHWKKPSQFEKALQRLENQAKTWFGVASYGLKAY